MTTDLQSRSINTLRFLAADMVQQANSGHPGLPMGAAAMAYTLWTRHLRHNPRNPRWPDRDRFILSGGHGSALLYALLYLTGYDLPLEELKRFRQWGSRTPGHPEYGLTPGVEVTTGPLGQGFANGVGFAIAEAHLAALFNRPGHEIVDHYTYALVTDGDLMEGVASEAASLAGHLRLGKLIYLYDDNHISIDGPTDLAFTEDRAARFEAYGWHVQRVADGNDVEAIDAAIRAAKADPRPSIIMCRTIIGYGAPHKQNTAGVHGAPLGEEELAAAKENLGWPVEPRFYVPEDVLAFFRQAVTRGEEAEGAWRERFESYRAAYPDLAAEFERRMAGELPPDWASALPKFQPGEKALATRAASGLVLNALAPALPELLGGSADLTPSNKTWLKGYEAFSAETPAGRNFHFGVREHA
ncbi:MAG: transketolase, partial [Anaerolineae bacterium]